MRRDTKTPVKMKKPTRQKIVVAQGRIIGTPEVEYKTLFTEIVADKESAKSRVKELLEEYNGTDALSVHYFSL